QDESVAFDVGFIDHIEAIFVAQVIKKRIVGIVRFLLPLLLPPPQALTASMKMTRITNHLKRFMPFDTPYILDVRHTHDGFGLFRPPVSITSPRMAMRDCLLFHIVEH